MTALDRELRGVFADGMVAVHGPGGPLLYAGLEERRCPREYQWTGRDRGPAEAPRFLFQYTLAGWGRFERRRRRWRVDPGLAFFAPLPSDHAYGLPEESPGWRFFWILFHHDYLARRLQAYWERHEPVRPLAVDAPLVASALNLLRLATRPATPTPQVELACLAWMLETERTWRAADYPDAPRAEMLSALRRQVLAALPRALVVAEIAGGLGMSRSHFSHAFRARTGQSPAEAMLRIRLEEAERRLRFTDDKLAAIGSACGFADANHFGKAFRRHYGLTPGQFRRQLRG